MKKKQIGRRESVRGVEEETRVEGEVEREAREGTKEEEREQEEHENERRRGGGGERRQQKASGNGEEERRRWRTRTEERRG